MDAVPRDEYIGPRRSRPDPDWVLPLALVTAAAIAVVTAAYAGTTPEPVAAAESPAPSRAASAVTRSRADAPITVTCDGLTFRLPNGERPDFTAIWAECVDHCEVERPVGVPLTSLERRAVTVAGYRDDADVEFLYGVCAEADPGGLYASADFEATPGQVAEIRGALVLCPEHPLAGRLRATAERGERDAELAGAGRLFGPGVFLVGAEIAPGTYTATGDIQNCYWERRGPGGAVLERYFSVTDDRVVVMIQDTDYAFVSQNCGRWRPA